jgi:hypothetical protein
LEKKKKKKKYLIHYFGWESKVKSKAIPVIGGGDL